MTRQQDIAHLDDAWVVSRDAARRIDREATERFGIPPIVLMENAAMHLAQIAADCTDGIPDARVVIVCGPGNNGGDGLALARHLRNDGMDVAIVLAVPHEQFAGDALVHLTVAERLQLPLMLAAELEHLPEADLVVDAIFGTGLSRRPDGVFQRLITMINEARRTADAHVLAVDTPSGLDCESGHALGQSPDASVLADTTVTFCGLKPGFLTLEAQDYIGEVVIADIGAPVELVAAYGERLSDRGRPGDDKRAAGRRTSSGGRR